MSNTNANGEDLSAGGSGVAFAPMESSLEDEARKITRERLLRAQKGCKRGSLPRSIAKAKHKFYLSSMIVSCSIPDAVLQRAIQTVATTRQPQGLTSLMKGHPLVPGSCYHTLLSRVINMNLNPDFVSTIPDVAYQIALNMEDHTNTVHIDEPYTRRNCSDILNLLCNLRQISQELKYETGTPEIESYQRIVKMISKLPKWLQILVEEGIKSAHGDLINLATNVTVENINWFLGKLKMASSIDYLDKIFRSPSVMGKCSAILKLLEIHELVWRSMDWSLIESLIMTVYSCLSFLMDKCKMAGNFFKEGWQWVAAKFRCEPGETDQFPNVGQDLPQNAEAQMMEPDGDVADLIEEVNQVLNEEEPEELPEVIVPNPEVEAHIRDLESTGIGRKIIEFIKKCYGCVYKFFKKNPIFGGFLGMFLTLSSSLGITISEFKNKGDKRSFFKKFSAASKDMYYLSRGKDSIFASMKEFFGLCRDLADIDDDQDVTDFKERLINLMESSEKFSSECSTNPGEFVNNPKKFHEFRKEVETIREHFRTMIKVNPHVNLTLLTPLFINLNKNYGILISLWNRHMRTKGIRRRAVCVWAFGRAGVGKSEFKEALIDTINFQNKTSWNAFSISKGPEYWNGFSQQEIIVIDDFMSYVGPEGPLDVLALLNLITNSDFNPNIAHLEDKLIKAEPSLVIICANFPTIPINVGVGDMLAFERRRDFVLELTWPEHERAGCPVEGPCAHITARDEARRHAGKMLFDHLTVKWCNSQVNSAPNLPRLRHGENRHQAQYKVDEQGNEITFTLDTLAVAITEKVAYYDEIYKMALARRRQAQAAAEEPQAQAITSDVSTWVDFPNVILTGPPGTGKSFMMETLISQFGRERCLQIATVTEFQAFRSQDFVTTKEYVFVDDTTTIFREEGFAEFMAKFKERADTMRTDIPLWVVGINPEVLRKGFFKCSEEEDVYFRRATHFTFDYRLLPGFRGALFQRYTREDVKKGTPQDIDRFVAIARVQSGISSAKFTNSGLVQWLMTYRPSIVDVSLYTELPVKTELKIDTFAEVNMSSVDFVGLMNSPGQFAQTLGTLMNGKFASSKHSKMEIGRKILKTFQAMSHVVSSYYHNMHDFVLAGLNGGFFNHFHGSNYVLKFTDCSFFIETVGERMLAGIYQPSEETAKLFAEAINNTMESVNSIDFLGVMTSRLPPWFMLCGDIIAIVFKLGLTFASVAHSVKENTALFRAMKMQGIVNAETEKFVEKGVKEVGDRFKQTLFPEKVQYVNTPRFTVDPKFETPPSDDESRGKPTKLRTARGKKGHVWNVKKQSACIDADLTKVEADVVFESAVGKLVPEVKDKAIAEAMMDPGLPSVIASVVPNVVEIQSATGVRLVYGLMVSGKRGTTVSHIEKHVDKNNLYVKTIKGDVYQARVTAIDQITDRLDFEITSPKCQNFKDVTNQMISAGSTFFTNKLGVLVTVTRDSGLGNYPVIQLRYYRIGSQMEVQVDTRTITVVNYVGNVVGLGILPSIETKAGDCGSLLFVCDSTKPQKLVGMHVAASSEKGFARFLLKGDYIERCEQQMCLDLWTSPGKEFEQPRYSVDLDGHEVYAKCAKKPFKPTKTRIYASPFAYQDCIYEPAVLDPKDPRAPDIDDMAHKESMKWVAPAVQMSESRKLVLFSRAAEIGDYYGQKARSNGLSTRVLSKTEALNKVSGYAHSKPVVMSTSPGYPWGHNKSKGKTRYIELLDNGDRRFAKNDDVKKLHNAVDAVINAAKIGVRGNVVFQVSLKDELLKSEKISSKTRTIAMAPLHYVIASRQYFHTIVAAVSELWSTMPVKVGISPNSMDWHVLYTHLLSCSDRGFTVDHQDFDFNVPAEFSEATSFFYNAFARITDKNWKKEDDVLRSGLHHNQENFYFISNSLVYKAKKGVASGHPATAVENSLISLIQLYDAWCEMNPDISERNLECFFQNVNAAIYGDDVKVAVSKRASFFGFKMYKSYLAKSGMLITDGDKTKDESDFRPLVEGSFLSRNFVFREGYWMGPLKFERLKKPLHFAAGRPPHHWYQEKEKLTTDLRIAAAAARSALDEAFFHGEDVYEDLRSHLLEVAELMGIDEYFPPYRVAHASYFSLPTIGPDDLLYKDFAVSSTLVPQIEALKGWLRHSNRSSLNLGKGYVYTGGVWPDSDIPEFLKPVLKRVNEVCLEEYNNILINTYPVGGAIPAHKDNEKGVDFRAGVTGLTVIGDGVMKWTRKDHEPIVLPCRPEFIYKMQGSLIKDWYHERSSHSKYTVSLTFRKMYT